MIAMLRDPEATRRMGQRAQEFAGQRFSVEPHVAERCLNHKLKGVEGVYIRHDYFEERRRALEAWGSCC